MKKLFLFLALIALLSSCSSDDNGILEAPVNKETKHKISFGIKNDGFTVEKASSRSTESFIQIITYKESGEVYADTLITASSAHDYILPGGSFTFSIELPEGNYHLAFISTTYYTTNPSSTPELFRLNPVNFYTDIYDGGIKGNVSQNTGVDANIGNYYETIDISISNTQKEQMIPVVLAPMWSNVSIIIEDPETFNIPIGANFVTIDLEPAYVDFSIQTKLAVNNRNTHHTNLPSYTSTEDIRKYKKLSSGFGVSQTDPENNIFKIKISFYREPHAGEGSLLLEKIIDLNTQVENGKNYKITGKLGNIAEVGNGKLKVTLTSFNENEVIDIPFE